jgi:hypothetical protein
MVKHPNRLWIIVLMLGWMFDFLFWDQSVGVNFAVFISISLIGGFYLLIADDKKPARRSLWLIAPLLFFAIMTFLRQEPLTLFLAYTFTLFSMGILAVTYLGGRWAQYSLLDYFSKFFQLIVSLIGRPVSFFTKIRKEQAERGDIKKRFPIMPILRGLLLALPIVACFASLLASADLIFSQKLTEFFEIFNAGRITEDIFRLIIIV